MKLDEAMKLLEDAHIDYMSIHRNTGGYPHHSNNYSVVVSFEQGSGEDNRVGYGETPSKAFDDAISKIHE